MSFPQRINVIGTSGSGKTTFARELAQRLGCQYVELDALYHGKNWAEPSAEEFKARIAQALSSSQHWIIDGNYVKARDMIWPLADTIIWLDYPMLINLWRVWWRTLRRIITQENLWDSGNRETWQTQFFSRHSMFLWVLMTHSKRRSEYPALLDRPENTHLRLIRFRWPHEAQKWLEAVESTQRNQD